MRIHKKSPHFRVAAILPPGPTLHAVLVGGHIRPNHAVEDEDAEQFFESESIDTGPELESLIKSGISKYFLIEDHDGRSALNEIEAVGYYSDGVTVIVHQAEQPYILCLIGENAKTQDWRNMARAVHALQRTHYEREKAGRPADLRKLQVALNQIRRGGFLKEKAFLLSKTSKLESNQNYLSNLRRKILLT